MTSSVLSSPSSTSSTSFALLLSANHDGSSHVDYPALNNSTMSKALELPQDKKTVEAPLTSSNMAFTGSIVEHAHNVGMQLPQQQAAARSSRPVSMFKMQRK